MLTERVRITKKFTFDMAHALMGYHGPCRNIHGHTYHLLVTVIGKIQNEENDNPTGGMVIDYSLLKKIVTENILNRFDHALVLNEKMLSGKKNYIGSLKLIFDKVLFVPYQPTCENLLLDIKNTLNLLLSNSERQLFSVRLQETPTSWAEWNCDDNTYR